MKELSTLIQTTHEAEAQLNREQDDDLGFSADSFRRSWQQAMAGETLPLSQLWDEIDDD